MSLVEEKLLTHTEHYHWFLVGLVFLDRSIVVCVLFWILLFVLFLLAIVLSVLLRFIDSDYSFGIFKLFLLLNCD